MASPTNISPLRSVKIAFWNANSIRDKKSELEIFIAQHNIDILLLSETKLCPFDRFAISNYTCIRTDAPLPPRGSHRCGGTAVIIKRSLKYEPLPIVFNNRLETTAIKLCVGRSSFVKIASVYARPTQNPTTSDLDNIFDSDIPTIAAGDFNAKHVSWDRKTCRMGKLIFNYAKDKGVKIITPSSPTHFGSNHDPTTIDFALANKLNYSYNIYSVSALSSDHDPVILELASAVPLENYPLRKHTVNWESYHHHTYHNITYPSRLTTHSQINEAIHTYNIQLKTAINAATIHSPADQPSFLPRNILNLIKNKNRTRKHWQLTRDPLIKTSLNFQITLIKLKIADFKNYLWSSHLESLTVSDGSIWKTIKSLTKDPFQSNITLKDQNGSIVSSYEGVAELFADSLELQFKLNSPVTPSDNEMLHNDHLPQSPLPYVTPRDIARIISSLTNKKAPGPDNITPLMLKHADFKATVTLTAILNACLRLQTFPDAWKTADVILFRKKHSSGTDPKNYRPISLLSIPSKILERVIHTHLIKDVIKTKILPDTQHGFRASHSTTHQITTVTEHILEGFTRRNVTGAVFLDVSKAFDRVWHDGLLFKMFRAGFSPPIITILKSFLTDRKFKVKYNSTHSSCRSIRAGVPQGSVLAPMLYNIFTHDIPQPTKNTMMIAQYADDTAILASSISTRGVLRYLNTHLRTLEDWFSTWKININTEKSAAMFFTRKKWSRFNKAPITQLHMYNTPIKWKNTTKYLGVTFDKRLSWSHHIDNTVKKAKSARARLFPLLKQDSTLSTKNKFTLYKTLLRPIMTYASPSWGYALLHHRSTNPLQTFQNATIRRCLNTNKYVTNKRIHADFKIPHILDSIKSQSTNFFNSIQNTHNKSLHKLTEHYIINTIPRPRNILDEFPFVPP